MIHPGESKEQCEPAKILIVEDEFVTGMEIQARINKLGYTPLEVQTTGEDAILVAGEQKPDLVLMDITLIGKLTGIEAANEIRKRYHIPVIFLSAHTDDITLKKATHAEPYGYITKPLNELTLKHAIQIGLYKHSMDMALWESEQRYRSIAELADDIIFIINRDCTMAYLNPSGKRFFEISNEILSIDNPSDIFPPDLSEQVLTYVKTTISTGLPQRITICGFFNERENWFDSSFIPILSMGENVIQIIGFMRDVTVQVMLEKELDKKGISQVEKNMEQFQILNDKIRNPLAIIVASASMAEGEMNDLIIEQANKIDDLVSQLDRGWIESEKIRNFLLLHYGHGKEIL